MDEITAEFQVADLASPVALRYIPRVSVGAKTDIGRQRENNEDKYEFYIPEDPRQLANRGLIFVVCDGMGGHEAGQIAAELATKTFIDAYLNHSSEDPETAAAAAVVAANRVVLDVGRSIPAYRNLGCTLSALMLIQDDALVAHVGDSRILRLRGGELAQLSDEHTWVEEQVRAGVIDRETAENHKYRHMLTRAIGAETTIQPQVDRFELYAGDTFVLCSDGLTNHTDEFDILRLASGASPSQAAWKLVAHALTAGGSDNVTVVVVRVDDLEALD